MKKKNNLIHFCMNRCVEDISKSSVFFDQDMININL